MPTTIVFAFLLCGFAVALVVLAVPPNATRLPRLIKLTDAAERLGIPAKTLRAEVQAGRLKCYRARPSSNSPILLAEAELLRWLESHAGQRQNVPSMMDIAAAKRASAPGAFDDATD